MGPSPYRLNKSLKEIDPDSPTAMERDPREVLSEIVSFCSVDFAGGSDHVECYEE
jgi:hypothetical protein